MKGKFNTSEISRGNNEKRELVLPGRPSKELSEFIGILIGDGNIYYNKKFRKYYLEITGDPILEREYFQYISNLIYKLLNKKPSIRINGRGLRLRLYSKEFIEFLIYDMKFPFGDGKGSKIKIPDKILSQNWKIVKMCVRGITDTDGSIFLSKKGNNLNYPCIEISTISKNLVFQLKKILSRKFRFGVRSYKKENTKEQFKISINGNKMVNKWINDIGVSNIRKLKKLNGTGEI